MILLLSIFCIYTPKLPLHIIDFKHIVKVHFVIYLFFIKYFPTYYYIEFFSILYFSYISSLSNIYILALFQFFLIYFYDLFSELYNWILSTWHDYFPLPLRQANGKTSNNLQQWQQEHKINFELRYSYICVN